MENKKNEDFSIAASQFLKEKRFWMDKLGGQLEISQFYRDFNVPIANTNQMEFVTSQFSGELYSRLNKLSGGSDPKLFMVLASGLVALIGKYTGNRDIIVGTPIYRQEIQGDFINTILALRNFLSPGISFKELLIKVRKCIIDANENQNYPLKTLLQELEIAPATSGESLFDIAIMLENIHEKNYLQLVQPNILFSFLRTGDALHGTLNYNSTIYHENTARQILRHYKNLLGKTLADVNLPIDNVDMFDPEEKKQLLADFNQNQTDYPRDKTIHRLFEEQAEKTPANTAAACYGHLDDIYDQLDSPVYDSRLNDKFLKCCFKKNEFLLHLENKAILTETTIFQEQEIDDIQLLWTTKNKIWKEKYNYVAVNRHLFLLLQLFDGNTNLGSLFKVIKNEDIAFNLCFLELMDGTGFLDVQKESFHVNNTINDFILLIKTLYNYHLIDLVDYHSRSSDVGVNWDAPVSPRRKYGKEHECFAAPSSIDTVSHTPGQGQIKSPVLLMGDTTGTATSGLVYMAGYLRRHGIEAYCQWNDLNTSVQAMKANIKKILTQIRPQVVGVSMKWFPHIARVLEICKTVKAFDSSILVVVGGNSASFFRDKIIRYDAVDYVISGDGELPILKICTSETDIPNCTFKKDGEIITTPITYVQNTETSSEIHLSHLDEIFVSRLDPYLSYPLFINIGKGCALQCFFCGGCQEAQKEIFNRPKPFLRGIKEVRQDIQAVKKYTTTFFFDSDIFFSKTYDFFTRVFEGLDLSNHYCAFFTNELPSPGYIQLLSRTFKYVYLHIDMVSLSERHRIKLHQLHLVKVQPTDKEVFEFFSECDKYQNLEVAINLITGVPYYTRDDIQYSKKMFYTLYNSHPSFTDLSWGRLHAQPAAPITNDHKKYGMYSKATTYEDFLHYSELNLKEDKYPGLDDIHYPYIYFNDDKLNSDISMFWAEADGKIKSKAINRRRRLAASKTVSFDTLNRQSNRLARQLRATGVGPNTLTGLMVESSLEMAVGILGILKAGGAYLPIDINYPRQRIDYMLKESAVPVILSQTQLISQFQGEVNTLNLEDENLFPDDDSNVDHVNHPGDLAYAIYTSGSTGQPKGVLIEHQNVLNYIYWRIRYYQQSEKDSSLQLVSISFDGFVANFYPALLSGGKTVLINENKWRDVAYIREVIKDECVTNLSAVPTMYRAVLEWSNTGELQSLRFVVLAGERANPGLIILSREILPHVRLVNEYGPTENSVTTTANCEMMPGKESIVGKPISNTNVFILDNNQNLKPTGTPGELCITGAGIARGYLNHPELTIERFIPNPYIPGKIIYKTGDRAKWLPEGHLELIGRVDHQIKIKGYRVEPGEIEAQLSAMEYINDAVVIERENEHGETFLCAYIVTDRNIESTLIRQKLIKSLPEYMIPSVFVPLASLPLTANGKVDRRALPSPNDIRTHTRPSGKVETKLADIWAKILGIDAGEISTDINFFELGGDSLKATLLASKIHKEFNKEILLAEIFRIPTIKDLASFIGEPGHDEHLSIETAEKMDFYPLSPAQKRLYFLQQMDLSSTVYNLPKILLFNEPIDKKRIEETFRKLIQRHESLRTSFKSINDEPRQHIHDEVEFEIEYYDLTGLSVSVPSSPTTPNLPDPAAPIIANFVRPFDLSRAPLLRTGLINKSENHNILLVDMHHITADGVSHQILLEDFTALYNGQELPPLRLQYKDYSVWQSIERVKNSSKNQENFWLKQFTGPIPQLNMPLDFPRPEMRSFAGDIVRFEITQEETNTLKHIAEEERATLFMLLLALFDIMLAKVCHQEDIVVGIPVAGRRHTDLEQIIGMFVNMLAIRSFPSANKTFIEFFQEVKELTLKGFENQDYQFEDLVEKVLPHREFNRNPLFDVVFSTQNIDIAPEVEETTTHSTAPTDFQSDQYEYGQHSAKFELVLHGFTNPGNLFFIFEYSTTIYQKKTMERLAGYFKEIVATVTQNPHIKIADIEIISAARRKELLQNLGHQTQHLLPTNTETRDEGSLEMAADFDY